MGFNSGFEGLKYFKLLNVRTTCRLHVIEKGAILSLTVNGTVDGDMGCS